MPVYPIARIVGIDHLVNEFCFGVGRYLPGHAINALYGRDQRLGHRRLGDKEGELDRRFQGGQDSVYALEAKDRALDGAGQIIFQVAQSYLNDPSGRPLDLDQILEVEDHVLVPVLDQQVEIGVDHRGFIPAADLERGRANTITLVDLRLHFRIFDGIDHFGRKLAVGRYLIFPQHIPYAWGQRR